jgi:hypothetical protein
MRFNGYGRCRRHSPSRTMVQTHIPIPPQNQSQITPLDATNCHTIKKVARDQFTRNKLSAFY